MSLSKKIVFLFLFIIASLTCCYFVFFNKVNLSPNYCFNHLDKEVLIVANHNIDFDTILKGPSSLFFDRIKNNVKFKKAYISQYKSKILIEFDNHNLDLGTEKILKSLDLKFYERDGYFELSNNWKCCSSESYLYFFKGKNHSKITDVKFNFINRDFGIYNFAENKLYSFNLTLKNLIKTHKSKLNTTLLNKNDFKLFADYIPNGIDNYRFFQKKYAEQNFYIESKGSFYKMINSGFTIFNYKGHEFIIAEKKQNIDPYLLLDEENGITEIIPGLRKKYEHIFLCSAAKNLNDFFYLEIYDNKLFFTESKEEFDCLKDLIIRKNVIKNDKKEIALIYGDQPSEVVYRNKNLITKNAIKFNKNFLTEYILITNKKKIKKEIISNEDLIQSFVIGKKYLFAFTNDEIIKFDNDIEIERVKFTGSIIDYPELIENNGEENLFFTTSEKLYLLDQDFRSLDGYPIVLKNKPKISFRFNNDNQKKLVGFSEKKVLSICDKKGNIKSRLNLELNLVKNPISFFDINNSLAVIYDDKVTYFIDLKSNKIINKIDLNYENTVFLTSKEHQSFYYIDDNKLFRNSFDGELKKCAAGNRLYGLKSFLKSELIGVLSDKNLALFDELGNCISKVKLPINNNVDYTVIQNVEGQNYIIIRDKFSNLVYIYNFDGESINHIPIKGSEKITVRKIGAEFQIYTIFNKKLLKYLI